MNKLFLIFLFTIFLISCGGGGYGGTSSNPNSYGNNPPTGNFAGQVDPVQATD